MRYLVVRKKHFPPFVAIWTQSQFRVEIQPNITRECSHVDYLKKHHISNSDVSSVGMVYYDCNTGTKTIQPASWTVPPLPDDEELVRKALISFCQNNPDLKDEIQYDWKEYKVLEKRYKELMEKRTMHGKG